MDKVHRVFEIMSGGKTIGLESYPGHPIIEIAGDFRILVENHQGVVEYGSERILIKVAFGIACVCGIHLEMIHMSKEQLVICGKIDSIQLQRGK